MVYNRFKMTTKHICVKKANLNKIGYENLREWLADKKNLYVGRAGRIFIKEDDGEMKVFHYKGSKWGNPFKVNEDIPVEKALQLYKHHLEKRGLIDKVSELHGYNLGCFCDQNSPCHAKILAELVESE
jgi:phage antirepressor YoqD-like protein